DRRGDRRGDRPAHELQARRDRWSRARRSADRRAPLITSSYRYWPLRFRPIPLLASEFLTAMRETCDVDSPSRSISEVRGERASSDSPSILTSSALALAA